MPSPEQQRLFEFTRFEEEARCQGYQCIAGIDEAGRGPLAGPVVAAACVIPKKVYFAGIDDSKKLSPKQRDNIFLNLTQNKRCIYGIAIVSHQEIDKINIYQATIQAMLSAISKLGVAPDYLLVDGMPLTLSAIPVQMIIQGDAKSQSIAAASILAKVTRDRIMCKYDEQWPEYGFKNHKGYATEQHLLNLEKYGPSPIHRKSYFPVKNFFIGGEMSKEEQLCLF